MAEVTQQHDETIRALSRNETKVEALAESMRELKKAIEELIDRVDADIDTLRTKAEGFQVTAAAVDDIKRRMTVAETKLEALALNHAEVKTKAETAALDKAKLDAKVDAIQARVWLASGAVGVIVWIAGRLFH